MNQDKNVGFNFFQVRCAHKSGDVINFIILACRVSSRLKWYKNYKNRLRLAKVIVKNKMSRFFMVHCVVVVVVLLICCCLYCTMYNVMHFQSFSRKRNINTLVTVTVTVTVNDTHTVDPVHKLSLRDDCQVLAH